MVEIGDPDDVTKRTLRNRDLTDMDKLREDIEKDDVRRIRTQDIDERRKFDDRLAEDKAGWKAQHERKVEEYDAEKKVSSGKEPSK